MSIFKPWSDIRTSLSRAQTNSHWTPRLDPIDSKSSLYLFVNIPGTRYKQTGVTVDASCTLQTNQMPVSRTAPIRGLYPDHCWCCTLHSCDFLWQVQTFVTQSPNKHNTPPHVLVSPGASFTTDATQLASDNWALIIHIERICKELSLMFKHRNTEFYIYF